LTGELLRLYPLPSHELEPGTLYEDLELPPPARDYLPRPYVVMNMVSSIDGSAVIGGKASQLGSDIDRQAMRTLRSKADAVMIGAKTLRAEKLSLGLDEFSTGPQPTAVIVTQTGDVPLETNLIATKDQEVLVVTAQDTPERRISRLHEHASVLRVSASPSGGVDLEETLKALRAERGVEILLVEGGPNLNHSLISEGLVNELFLTLAPKLVGGISEHTVLDRQALAPVELNLLSVHLANSELYFRFALL
jgi:2,5-diamino-6-(ribosylamino)-4(3H)-pyrimidinone 5'-phosphate reductase